MHYCCFGEQAKKANFAKGKTRFFLKSTNFSLHQDEAKKAKNRKKIIYFKASSCVSAILML
jgi:uncharacterized protein (DUF2252 family)